MGFFSIDITKKCNKYASIYNPDLSEWIVVYVKTDMSSNRKFLIRPDSLLCSVVVVDPGVVDAL